MIFSGQMTGFDGEHSLRMSQLMRAFEAARCEVKRNGSELEVLMPGLDSLLVPDSLDLPVMPAFADQYVVSLDANGSVRYQLKYWTIAQGLIHALVTSMLCLEFSFSRSGFTFSEFAACLFLGNLLPVLFSFLSVQYSKHFILARVLKG